MKLRRDRVIVAIYCRTFFRYVNPFLTVIQSAYLRRGEVSASLLNAGAIDAAFASTFIIKGLPSIRPYPGGAVRRAWLSIRTRGRPGTAAGGGLAA